MLDYKFVRHPDIKDVLVSRAIWGADCWTDHRIIMPKLRVTVWPNICLCRLMKRVFLSKNLSLQTKVAVYPAVCLTVLYGCETVFPVHPWHNMV